MSRDVPAASLARSANVRNNAMHQPLRLERWAGVRDRVWALLEPLVADGSRVALVGGGSCDDLPLRRLLAAGASVELVDLDAAAMVRARLRAGEAAAGRLGSTQLDVTGGAADLVLRAVEDGTALPESVPLPWGAIGSGDYDLVVADMLYTQLLHPGLLSLDLTTKQRSTLMRRFDPPFSTALVHRVQASLAPGGHALHLHDLACWTTDHPQPLTIRRVLQDPSRRWRRLRRHDGCDPHLVLERLGADIRVVEWWEWPFEPAKRFLVRATVARAAVGASAGLAAFDRR